MKESTSRKASVKLCLNHSQAGIEAGLVELEMDFRSWCEHPHHRVPWTKLMEHLV